MFKIETKEGKFYTTDQYCYDNGFIEFKDKYGKVIQLNKKLAVKSIREV